MKSDKYRRAFGLIFGALLGLVFGVISQGINPLMLPGINYYQPPFGPVLNALLCVLIGAVLGLLSAWFAGGYTGVFAASVVGALFVQLAVFLTGRADSTPLTGKVLIVIFMFLPAFGAMVPVNLILHWVISREEEEKANHSFTPLRVLVPLGVLLVVGLIASRYLYKPEARQLLARTNNMIQSGLQATNRASLPPALSEVDGSPFNGNATPVYSLEWDKNELSRFAIPHPAKDEYLMSVVIARFDNDWRLVCLYVPGEAEPRCRGFAVDDPIFGAST